VTQIDFYILPDDADESRLTLACRLAGKAVQQRLGVFVLAATEADAHKLDELLWTHAQNSFLPHRFAWEADDTAIDEPIVIGCPERAVADAIENGSGPAWDLIINLGAEVPSTFGRYQRLAEVVDAKPERREQGRERYRFYRDRGYELNTHQL
jgi:DNA polymerase-3 subunit chi